MSSLIQCFAAIRNTFLSSGEYVLTTGGKKFYQHTVTLKQKNKFFCARSSEGVEAFLQKDNRYMKRPQRYIVYIVHILHIVHIVNIVYRVHTVHMVHIVPIVHIVNIVYMVHTVHIVHTVHMVHIVPIVQIEHIVHMVHYV